MCLYWKCFYWLRAYIETMPTEPVPILNLCLYWICTCIEPVPVLNLWLLKLSLPNLCLYRSCAYIERALIELVPILKLQYSVHDNSATGGMAATSVKATLHWPTKTAESATGYLLKHEVFSYWTSATIWPLFRGNFNGQSFPACMLTEIYRQPSWDRLVPLTTGLLH